MTPLPSVFVSSRSSREESLFRLANLFKSRSRSPIVEQTRRSSLEPLEERQLLSVTLRDAMANAPLAHQDTVYLTSYLADSSGQAYDPVYGETVYRRLTFKNTGDDPIEISSAALSSGSRVELVGEFAQNFEPNEETSFLLKWQALETESSTFTIQTDAPDQPTFQIALSGAVRANTTQYAQLEDVGLLVDSGVSATDSVTCNPTITGEITGALYGGRVDVEFDFNADSVVDALESVYVVGAFTFDPSEYSSAYAAQLTAVEELFGATQFADGRGEYDAFLQGTSSDQTDYFDEIVSTSSQVVSTQSSANSADATLATQNASALASAQASNAAAYTVATEQADADYVVAVNGAWNDAYLEQLGVASDLKDAYDLATSTLNTSLENHVNNYRDAFFSAYDEFEGDWNEIARVLSYQQSRIDSGLTVGSNVFENPVFDFEVCFVAGTPVLMADGTTKPIEEIRPGDMVLSANHLDPEGKTKAARVARFFDNGEKTVVRLVVGEQELVCTPERPFYVVGKGWVRADALVEDDLCLNANGERVAFVSREALAEARRVYNIEVEGTHTYFVGEGDEVLAHNACGHHYLPCGVLTRLAAEEPELFSQLSTDSIKVAGGYYSGKLNIFHYFDRAHRKYNKEVYKMLVEFLSERKDKSAAVTSEEMFDFIKKNVKEGVGINGEVYKDVRNYNSKIGGKIDKKSAAPEKLEAVRDLERTIAKVQ